MKQLFLVVTLMVSGCFFVLDFNQGSFCGDGLFIAQQEECDDGNNIDAQGFPNPLDQSFDSCNADCTLPRCGNGRVEPFATIDSDGDGVVNFADNVEECDDGNAIDGDGCSAVCLNE